MAETSAWFTPVEHSDRIDLGAVDQQLELLQTDYDSSGLLYWGKELSWLLWVTCDARGFTLPAKYQSKDTTLTATAQVSRHNTKIGVTVGTAEGLREVYDLHQEEDMPHIHQLLGEIACVDLAEFAARPAAALQGLKCSKARQFGAATRQVAQKTFDPEGTETQAVHLTLIKVGGLHEGGDAVGYTVNFGRPVTTPEGNFVYWQHAGMSATARGTFHQYRRIFQHGSPPLLGERHSWHEYQKSHYQELADTEENQPTGYRRTTPCYSDFETTLRDAGNLFVGALAGEDINRLIHEPLTTAHRLRLG